MAYIDVGGLFGNEKALEIWDAFYEEMTSEYQLTSKVVLEVGVGACLALTGWQSGRSGSGKNYFSFEDNSSLIETCRDLEEETGIKIIHETHRGRFLYHSASRLPYLDHYPEISIRSMGYQPPYENLSQIETGSLKGLKLVK